MWRDLARRWPFEHAAGVLAPWREHRAGLEGLAERQRALADRLGVLMAAGGAPGGGAPGDDADAGAPRAPHPWPRAPALCPLVQTCTHAHSITRTRTHTRTHTHTHAPH
jgi:hypothetical protein